MIAGVFCERDHKSRSSSPSESSSNILSKFFETFEGFIGDSSSSLLLRSKRVESGLKLDVRDGQG